jgi:hypothetical protein
LGLMVLGYKVRQSGHSHRESHVQSVQAALLLMRWACRRTRGRAQRRHTCVRAYPGPSYLVAGARLTLSSRARRRPFGLNAKLRKKKGSIVSSKQTTCDSLVCVKRLNGGHPRLKSCASGTIHTLCAPARAQTAHNAFWSSTQLECISRDSAGSSLRGHPDVERLKA